MCKYNVGCIDFCLKFGSDQMCGGGDESYTCYEELL